MENTPVAAPVTADTAAPPPAAPQTPAWTGHDWLKDLPDEVRSDKSLHKYSNVESAARGLINAQRMIGMDKVPRPRGDFDPANPDWQAFLDAAGRPKSPEEYQFEEAKLPDGVEYSKELEGKFRAVSYQMGLNGKQAGALRDMYVAAIAEATQQAQLSFKQSRDEAEGELKRELGEAFEPTVNASKAALKEYADDRFVKWLDDNGLGNHPELVRVFGKIGKELIGDSKLKTPNEATFNTPADYKRQADEFRVKYSDALFNQMHPEHKMRSDELWKLTQKAFGE